MAADYPADPAAFEHAATDANFYELLGVTPSASQDDLKVAYRRLALLYHPDRHGEAERPAAERVFRRIAAAYAMLSDPDDRGRYDAALARGIALEPEQVEKTVSLRDILSALQTQEHVFAGKSLDQLSTQLSSLVRENLIADLHEQVVETVPLRQPPSGASCEGTFQSGALVMTTLRLLFPYTSQSQTVRGNTRTTTTYVYLQGIALPSIREMRVFTTSRRTLAATLKVSLSESSMTTVLKTRNITKLYLLCRYWGIPMVAEEQPDKTQDRRALLWLWPVGWAAAAAAGAWLLSLDASQCAAIAWCVTAGYGYYRYRTLYAPQSVAEWLRGVRGNDAGAVSAVSAT